MTASSGVTEMLRENVVTKVSMEDSVRHPAEGGGGRGYRR